MTRLSNLEDVYNELVRVDFNFDQLPENSKYKQYYKYKTDPDVRALPEGSAQEQGIRQKVGISPFGLLLLKEEAFIVGVSDRSLKKVGGSGTDFGSLDTVYGIKDTILPTHRKQSGFIPAKVVFAEKLATPQAVSKDKNRITGRAYKRRTGETFTLPFGRTGDTSTEFGRQGSIITQVEEKYAVTFKPERLKRNK